MTPLWSSRRGSWVLQAAAAATAVLFLTALVFAPPVESFCAVHGTGCGLLSGFLSTTLVAVAGYFVLVVWDSARARPRYLRIAQETPERLLSATGAVRLDDIIRRQYLIDAVIAEAGTAPAGPPILVVGAAGTGKTTFLLDLISRLAQRRKVPVACSLRGVDPPLELRDLARRRFLAAVDPLMGRADNAERMWRRLWVEHAIVVVVDGLDEFMPGRPFHDRDQAVRATLAQAQVDGLPVVIATRPESLPIGAAVSVFELPALPKNDVLEHLRQRVPATAQADASLVELAQIGAVTPYYLDVIALTARFGPPAAPTAGAPPNRDALLVGMLDQWVELIVAREVLGGVELDSADRRMIIDGLGDVAAAMTGAAALDRTAAQIDEDMGVRAGIQDGAAGVISAVVDGASRLGLVETFAQADHLGIRFHHAIAQAYFLSRYLDAHPDQWRALVAGPPTAELNRALVMWCARAGDPARAREIAEGLDERAAQLDADRALLLRVTSEEVFHAGGAEESGQPRRRNGTLAWQRASPRTRLAAVRRLQNRNDPWSLRILYEQTQDPVHGTYRTRWAASQGIVRAGPAAWYALAGQLQSVGATARGQSAWTDQQCHEISVAAWLLPGLAASMPPEQRQQPGAVLADVAGRLPDLPPGTEASLAQGYLLAAAHYPGSEVPAAAWALLDAAQFWYSRLVLVHAVTLHADGAADRSGAVANRLLQIARTDRNPFVRAAADMCARNLRAGRPSRRCAWIDEVALISGSGAELDDDAARLLADVVLMLNLTEQGPASTVGAPGDLAEAARREAEQRKQLTYRQGVDLPVCLTSSTTRGELFDGCSPDCPSGLCPYPATAERALARGELSAAFCRHLAVISARDAMVRARLSPSRRYRWSALRGRAAVRFWRRMESRGS